MIRLESETFEKLSNSDSGCQIDEIATTTDSEELEINMLSREQ